MAAPRKIGILGFAGAEALDIVGPFDVFRKANDLAPGAARPYEPAVLGLTKRPFSTESGLCMLPHADADRNAQLDTLLVPGGAVLRDPKSCAPIARWLAGNAERARRVVSICTGLYALAQAGLLERRRATTHWRFAADAAKRWPNISIDPNAIFVRDGKYWTSAGITAGIDLALSLVEEDLGSRVSVAIARELVVYVKRSGGQLQYSEPLRYQSHEAPAFDEIVAWMRDHLGDDLSVETIADRANLGSRHFSRRFKQAFGMTPAAFVEDLRLDQARWRLANHHHSIRSIAISVGYQGDDAFRRAFQRRFGVTPRDYRARFAAAHRS